MADAERTHFYKLRRALQAQTLLEEPPNPCRCRAQVRVHTGSGRSRWMGGVWVQCSKHPRAGKRTCHWHRHLEDDDGP